MSSGLVRAVRPTWQESLYVGVVVALAAAGFVTESPAPILLAALIALPASILGLPAYYAAFGLLALLPGANPSSSSGSGGSDQGTLTLVEDGPAAWFTLTTEIVGVLALGVSAIVNVLILRMVVRQRRARNAPRPG